ncbi:MAG: extracellular solute-binding protein [Candidatus Schekmanbacteria bacterium]|nr:extracellular solute-binding protein [Candidatus Schekmanbacteria bacterium]
MTTMRRTLRAWRAGAAVALLLTAAGLVSAQQGTRVTLWHAYSGLEAEALERVVGEVDRALADVTIAATYYPFSALPDRVPAADKRGKGPDLFIFAHDRIGGWARDGVIRPVDSLIAAATRGRFFASALAAATVGGKLYGLPMSVKTVALYYNRNLIRTPPDTLDELVTAARRLTNPSEERYGLAYEYNNFYYHAMWFQAFGGGVFDASGKLSLTTAAHVRGFELLLELRDKILPKEVSKAYIVELFNKGKAAMVIDGPWLKGDLRKDLDYGISLLPSIGAEDRMAFQRAEPFLTSELVLMLASCPHPEAAAQVMEGLTSAASQIVMASHGGQVPANIGAYGDMGVYQDPDIMTFRQQALLSTPMPNLAEMAEVWGPATAALGWVLVGSKTPVDAMREAQAQVEAAIAEHERP